MDKLPDCFQNCVLGVNQESTTVWCLQVHSIHCYSANSPSFPWCKHVVVHVTSGGGELLVAASMEALEEELEDDELTDTLAFLSTASC